MDNVARFAALYAKVRALQSRMLATADYEALLRCESEAQVIAYILNKTDYGKSVKIAGSGEFQMIELERALRQYLFDRYEQMMYFVIDAERRLFKALLLRYEIESLKMVIRTVYSGLNDDAIGLTITTSRHFQIQNFEQLLQAPSLEKLVDSLMATPYGAILRPYLTEDKARMLFYMEMNLDRYYFKRLSDSIVKLKGEGRQFMEISFGSNVDFLNIQWIYRGIKHYDLSPEELFNYCLRGGRYLNLKQLQALCYAPDDKAFSKLLLATRYNDVFGGDRIDLVIERDMERALYRIFRQLVKEAQLNLITPIAYLHALEFEVRDLFAIIEAKRYQMDEAQTRAFLVRQF